jgi:leucyl-tRNA synthetase
MAEHRYDPHVIEPKWRTEWEAKDLFRADLEAAADPCYALVMFAYPSGDRLHVGHWYHYGPADTWARFQRMCGRSVFEPFGFDAFGLPAENYAVRTGIHPRDSTDRNVATMIEQLKTMGAMWDWERTLNTSEPEYYKWTQWLFLELYRAGLAHRKAAPVWWCPTDQTVLANEQVVEGNVCERCGSDVEKRDLTQWFFKITNYADELLDGLDEIDWPERTKTLQRNWIGRSTGVEIDWQVADREATIKTFTTRPDTLYGVTFLALAPEHDVLDDIVTDAHRAKVGVYRDRARRLSEIERTSTEAEKTGEFTGAYAIHPLTNEQVPIWVADFVLAGYGTGAIQGVPAHDERDFDFVRAMDLPVVWVIEPESADIERDEAYTGHGRVIASGPYTGMRSEEMLEQVTADLVAKGDGKATVHYRLRDWLISRQRYWGAPIPIVHCSACGEVPVAVDDLPVELPYDIDFSLGAGKSPLERSESFMNVACPSCGSDARRDPDTMDTFVDSAWYFLRYLSPDDDERPWNRELVDRWCPIYQYSGGIEHAVLHLLYARFMVKAMRDLGHLGISEPFRRLVHQGTITNRGTKMSKSRDNVISPDDYIEEYGADAFRTYLMFGFAFTEGGDWKDAGIKAVAAWLQRVWRLVDRHRGLWDEDAGGEHETTDSNAARSLRLVLHRSVKGATQDLASWQFNTAIARIMELVNECYQYAPVEEPGEPEDPSLMRTAIETVIRLLAPIAPHLGEELWVMTGRQPPLIDAGWPDYDPEILRTEEVTVVIQINGKVREEMSVPRDLPDQEVEARALAHGRIPELLDGQQVRKVIVVPNKLVSLVV